MKWLKSEVQVQTRGKGLYNFTGEVEDLIMEWGIEEGICHLFVQHTSASLVVSESYDPSARIDLENFMEKLVPENQDWFKHVMEGADDSPSHLRAMLTDTSLSVPIDGGRLSLGTWQGIYLFEHRARPHHRTILVRCLEAP